MSLTSDDVGGTGGTGGTGGRNAGSSALDGRREKLLVIADGTSMPSSTLVSRRDETVLDLDKFGDGAAELGPHCA
jgi:hypothetical protein